MPAKLRALLDVTGVAKRVWKDAGYGEDDSRLTVIDHVGEQSADISTGAGTGVDAGGAGDQGVMVGFATTETPEMMPREWVLARDLCQKISALRARLSWLGSDIKTQISLGDDGGVTSVIIAAQHSKDIDVLDVREQLIAEAVEPIVGCLLPKQVKVNGTGRFVLGGPTGDAGVVGRKIVVDAYGPRVPVGGGAYSGKDPTKVDRTAAYMARHIAKSLVMDLSGSPAECTVKLAYGIGQIQPEMVTAQDGDGRDLSSEARRRFPDLSPSAIADRFSLWKPTGWSYFETASYGHYGRPQFPWEKTA
jgi:S-adenosylmethionine synthetase